MCVWMCAGERLMDYNRNSETQQAEKGCRPYLFYKNSAHREKIFLTFSKEIPYSCEVAVTAFKDQPKLLKINATLFTTRDSHVPILIGTRGAYVTFDTSFFFSN